MFTITIKAQDQAVRDKVAKLPGALDRAIATGLSRGMLHAVAVAQLSYLSGPRPAKLDIVTRRLQQSISSEVEVNGQTMTVQAGGNPDFSSAATPDTGSTITGRIGSNVKYAAYHEFGFHGIVNVAAHVRVLAQFSAKGKAFDPRRPVRTREGKLVGYRDTRVGTLGGKQTSGSAQLGFVAAHKRNVNYAGRPYLRPALSDSLETIEREINKEIAAI